MCLDGSLNASNDLLNASGGFLNESDVLCVCESLHKEVIHERTFTDKQIRGDDDYLLEYEERNLNIKWRCRFRHYAV